MTDIKLAGIAVDNGVGGRNHHLRIHPESGAYCLHQGGFARPHLPPEQYDAAFGQVPADCPSPLFSRLQRIQYQR